MTVYEFRREVETKRRRPFAPEEPSGIETLTVRADAADIAVIMTLVRDRLIADMPAPAGSECTRTDLHRAEECGQESAVRPGGTCVACGAEFTIDPTAPILSIKRCTECVAAGFKPLDGPS